MHSMHEIKEITDYFNKRQLINRLIYYAWDEDDEEYIKKVLHNENKCGTFFDEKYGDCFIITESDKIFKYDHLINKIEIEIREYELAGLSWDDIVSFLML